MIQDRLTDELQLIILEALMARATRHARGPQFRDNLQGLAYSERISQSAHKRAELINLARSICANPQPSMRREGSEVTSLEQLQALGCVRVVVEASGGHWARQSARARGWAAWLHLWDGTGWVAWWEHGQPALPVLALRLDLEEIPICQ